MPVVELKALKARFPPVWRNIHHNLFLYFSASDTTAHIVIECSQKSFAGHSSIF